MIDLHLHLDGSLNPKNILTMAKMSHVDLPTTDEKEINKLLMVEPDCTNLGEYLEKFDLPLKVLQTKECLEFAVYELMRDLHKQGLCYVEIRFAPQLHTQKGLTQESVVEAAIKGLNKGINDFGLLANLILCCMRGDNNHAENFETIRVAKNFLGKGVCAVDLAGNEAAFPTKSFFDVFQQAKQDNIPITIHAGEAADAKSVHEALELQAVRIGHGIHAIEDLALMECLKDKNIFLELCYTSNLQTRTVANAKDYPLVKFIEKGIRVTINTDNTTVSHTSLKREYRLLKKQFNLDNLCLQQLVLNGVDAAFVNEKQRVVLKEAIKQNVMTWLEEN